MDNQPVSPIPASPVTPSILKKSFSLIFVILFLISTVVAVWFYYQNLQLKQQQKKAMNQALTVSPVPNSSPSPLTDQAITWKTTKRFSASFEYPVGWHVAELWQENFAQNGVLIAIDPDPISTAPRGGPLATFEITFLNGNPNPDAILQQRIDRFNTENYYDITKETINASIGPVYHYKGKAAGEMMKGAAMESYFFTFNRNPSDLMNQQVVIANLIFKDDPKLSEMLRHIVLSFKELQQ